MIDLSFYKGKTVLITGHTGFKGSWLSEILILSGANVIGYSLEPPTNPSLFKLLSLENRMISIIGDIRDFNTLLKFFNKYNPEIVFHLAAQPIVRDSYKNPLYTYETNVIGTANICECIRLCKCVKSFVNITTDKVYENRELIDHKYKEDEKLDGFDPYSNSKSCSEILTHSYFRSFLYEQKIPTSTVRAGNVIGGGDFSNDRIIPDAMRAFKSGTYLEIRNPNSVRPYQHVLDALFCYLLIAKEQYYNLNLSGAYNIGPDDESRITTEILINKISILLQNKLKYKIINENNAPHEAKFLSIDNSKIKNVFGWSPLINIEKGIKLTCEWYDCWVNNEDIKSLTDKQILEIINE